VSLEDEMHPALYAVPVFVACTCGGGNTI